MGFLERLHQEQEQEQQAERQRIIRENKAWDLVDQERKAGELAHANQHEEARRYFEQSGLNDMVKELAKLGLKVETSRRVPFDADTNLHTTIVLLREDNRTINPDGSTRYSTGDERIVRISISPDGTTTFLAGKSGSSVIPKGQNLETALERAYKDPMIRTESRGYSDNFGVGPSY